MAWGTAPGQAKLREEATPAHEEASLLAWRDIKLANLSCDVVYVYVQDKLVRGKYIVTETWVNENRFLAEYDSLKSLLKRKYGEPETDDSYWSNKLWADDPNDWGRAVEQGHLALYCRWERGDTRILLHLSGENYQSSLGIEYASLTLESLESHHQESAVLNDL